MTDDLEKLIEARREIDRALMEHHSTEMAVMFTDMVGSTRFFEERGDIDGLALLRRHNDLMFPVVEAHRGRVVKTVGDAIMAVFEAPGDAVRCAAAMQHTLVEANQKQPSEAIEVRIGVHAGSVMMDGDDVFGDTVNTAARIAHEAQGSEVLLSRSLYETVTPAEGLGARPRSPLQLKGKAEPLPVVELVWEDADAAHAARLAAADRSEVFVLELGVGVVGLRVAALDGARDKGTVKAYADVPLSVRDLDAIGQSFDPFLKGQSSKRFADEIRERGATLFDKSLSERAKHHLAETELDFLRLHLDDELVHLPWELMHDGRAFLGARFAVGRMVTARAEASPYDGRPVDPERDAGHVLVISNPTGDLASAAREGEAVTKLLSDRFAGEVRHLTGTVGRSAFLDSVVGCRLLHFAGHAVEASESTPGGFKLHDGVLAPEDVAAAIAQSPPTLVFANSCHSGTGGGWRATARGVFNLASALLMRGAQHYLAPMWQVPDDDALTFSLRFYEQALSGVPLGEATRLARKALRDPAAAGGYALYGEPRDVLVAGEAGHGQRHRSVEEPAPKAPAAPEPPKKTKGGQGLKFAGLFVLVLAAAWGFVWALLGDRTTTEPPPVPAVPSRPTPPPAEDKTVLATPKPQAKVGPLRLSMLDFKNLTGDEKLDFLSGGIAETLVTDFGQRKDVRLIERGQIDLDLKEVDFAQTKYVDPATRALLGRIVGAEVVVLGGYQKAGNTIRATARFIDVETGEVLSALRLERPADKIFEMQDALAIEVRKATDAIIGKLRP